uniref:Uncharacterized protein n=1 Tax=Arundo donax TaxID=35708 RepID=A0A0A9BNJ7_ARUDO
MRSMGFSNLTGHRRASWLSIFVYRRIPYSEDDLPG